MMEARVFHDAVIDRLARTSTGLEAQCSMVSVYENSSLVRQESGALRVTGVVPQGAIEPTEGSETGYDDANILDLTAEAGVVTLLVEWENYSSGATVVHRYTRELGTMTWDPDLGETVVLARRDPA